MRLGEALATCPELVLVEQDPAAVEREWEGVLRRLEDAGFAVEPGRAGLRRTSRRRESSGSTEEWRRRSNGRSPPSGLPGIHARALPSAGSPPSRRRASRVPGRFSSSEGKDERNSSRRCRSRCCRSPARAVRGAGRARCAEAGRARGVTGGRGRGTARAGGTAAWALARGGERRRVRGRPAAGRARGGARVPGGGGERADAPACVRLAARPAARAAGAGGTAVPQGRARGPARRRRLLAPHGDAARPDRRPGAAAGGARPEAARDAGARRRAAARGGRARRADRHAARARRAAGATSSEARLREGLRQVRASAGSGSVCAVVEVAPWSRIPEARALFVPRDD